jgi:tetratricopeptide (TPR) repeat protein
MLSGRRAHLRDAIRGAPDCGVRRQRSALIGSGMVGFAFRKGGWLAPALVVLSALAILPAHAENVLSDILTDQILQVQRRDMNRRLESDFEQSKKALGDAETGERAVKLRALLKKQAETYELLEDFSRAEAAYTAALDVKPADPAVYYNRGYFYMRLSRYAESVRDFMTGSRLAPTQAAFSYGAGRALTRMGDFNGALKQYNEAIRLAPDDSVPLLSRAEVLAQLKRFAEARADYDLAIRLGLRREEDRFFVYFGRGYANIFLGNFDGAIQDLDTALASRGDMVNAVVWRGYAHERIGQRDLALNDYEAARRLDPKDTWIRDSIRRMRL